MTTSRLEKAASSEVTIRLLSSEQDIKLTPQGSARSSKESHTELSIICYDDSKTSQAPDAKSFLTTTAAINAIFHENNIFNENEKELNWIHNMEVILDAFKAKRDSQKDSCQSRAFCLAILCAVAGLCVFIYGWKLKGQASEQFSRLASNCTESADCRILNPSDLCRIGFCNYYGDSSISDSYIAVGIIGGVITSLGAAVLRKCFKEPTVDDFKNFNVNDPNAAELVQNHGLLTLLNQLAAKLGIESFSGTTPVTEIYRALAGRPERLRNGVRAYPTKLSNFIREKYDEKVFSKGFACLFEPKVDSKDSTKSATVKNVGSHFRKLPADVAHLISPYLTRRDLVTVCTTSRSSYEKAAEELKAVSREELSARYRGRP